MVWGEVEGGCWRGGAHGWGGGRGREGWGRSAAHSRSGREDRGTGRASCYAMLCYAMDGPRVLPSIEIARRRLAPSASRWLPGLRGQERSIYSQEQQRRRRRRRRRQQGGGEGSGQVTGPRCWPCFPCWTPHRAGPLRQGAKRQSPEWQAARREEQKTRGFDSAGHTTVPSVQPPGRAAWLRTAPTPPPPRARCARARSAARARAPRAARLPN